MSAEPLQAVTLRLAVAVRPAPAVFWVRPRPAWEVVADLLHHLGPDAADGFELMSVGKPAGLTLVRTVRSGAVPPWIEGGFYETSVCQLYLPVGRRLYPTVPPGLAPPAGHLRWLTDDGELVLHTAKLAFRPLADWWAATAPGVRRLTPVVVASPFVPLAAQLDVPVRPGPLPSVVVPAVNLPVPRPSASRRLRATLPRVIALVQTRPPPAVPDDLCVLEGRLVADSAALGPIERAGRWAELASAYRTNGRTSDAAVCWLNAAWCHPAQPARWPQPWRAAVARPDAREAELPVRAVWLDRLARYEQDDDALALARCRDRLFTRLATGPEPDLDVPGFVRRSDRRPDPNAARGWLTAAAGPMRKWLAACTTGTRLTAAGLDADRAATRCYAELIRAWGLATTGDRSAVGLATTAAAELTALRRPADVDPVVHRLLADRFNARIRAALTGEPADLPHHDSTATGLATFDRYAVDRLRHACGSLGANHNVPPLDTAAARLAADADAARVAHQPDRLRQLLDDLDPPTALATAGALVRAAHALGLRVEAAGLVASLSALDPPPGGRRDLGLAVGRFLTGDPAGGERALDAARHRLFVTGVPDPRQRGESAVAYATAVGYAAPSLVLGRLDELFRRLGPVFAGGACGRYFALLPLRVVDAAVRAAVGDDFAPSAAVRRWLADEEWQTRRRIHHDMRRVCGNDPL